MISVYINDSKAEKTLATLKQLSEKLPTGCEGQDRYRFYKDAYDFKPGDFFPAAP